MLNPDVVEYNYPVYGSTAQLPVTDGQMFENILVLDMLAKAIAQYGGSFEPARPDIILPGVCGAGGGRLGADWHEEGRIEAPSDARAHESPAGDILAVCSLRCRCSPVCWRD